MSLIELENIKKLYFIDEPNQFAALDGVSLKIEKGDMLAITGASGSGKSTLMNIIGCLDRPTSGVYKFEGREIENFGKNELVKIRRNKIGFIFQNFNILPRMQAVTNVELPLVYRGIKPNERRAKAKEMLQKVGLSNKIRHKPNMLSGGELQRVAIARALVNDPAIIVADEPSGNLDTKSGQQIMNILEELNQQGTTILIVTHDKEIASHAKKIIKLKDGRVVE